MNKLFENISLKTGLTKAEISTSFFAVFVFILGFIAKEIKFNSLEKPVKNYSYSYQDSLFKAITESKSRESDSFKKKEKRVDSEVELYDFSSKKLVSKKQNNIQPKKNSININTADVKTFETLPGIGEKIAKRIIDYRKKFGSFKSLDELNNVKGIGQKKLKKIMKFIYLEK